MFEIREVVAEPTAAFRFLFVGRGIDKQKVYTDLNNC
jgi:hypothetical protein